MTSVQKVVTRFDPISPETKNECERHYSRVHVPYAASYFTRDLNRLAYYTELVMEQLALTGRFDHRVEAWRFVKTYMFAGSNMSNSHGDPTSLPPEMQVAMARDIPQCLKNLRRCLVDERMLFDRPGQRMGGVTYLFEYEAERPEESGDLRAELESIAVGVCQRLDSVSGARRLTLDLVSGESQVRAVNEPGQQYTGALTASSMVGFVWFDFDNDDVAGDFFSLDGVAASLLGRSFRRAAGYRVTEDCVFDKRRAA